MVVLSALTFYGEVSIILKKNLNLYLSFISTINTSPINYIYHYIIGLYVRHTLIYATFHKSGPRTLILTQEQSRKKSLGELDRILKFPSKNMKKWKKMESYLIFQDLKILFCARYYLTVFENQ